MTTRTTNAETSPQTPALPLSWLGVLALLTAVAPLSIDMYLPAFPAMAAEFGTSASAIQFTLTSFMVGLASGQLIIGPLSDRFGRRPLMLAGTFVCILAGVACAVAPNIAALTAFRFVQGFSGAAGVVLSRAVVADRAHGAVAARAFSLMMIINGAAPVLAPLIGGSLMGLIGWRGVFWILAGLAVAMFLGVVAVLPETHPQDRRHTGGVTAMLSDARSVLTNRGYIGYTLAFAFGFTVMFAYISASPFVLQNVLGLSPLHYSFAFAANAAGIVIVNAVNARIVSRFGQRRLLHLGIGLLVLFSVLLVVDALLGPVLWASLLLLWGAVASLGLVAANATSLALDQVRHAAGTGSAVLGALQFGLAALVSPIVGLGGDHTALPMAVAMVVSACIAAGALTLTRRGAAA
ncbi:multidrug effflux MFS transporter [Mycolicibacterium fortuitum]|uniref:Multidrug effflux MFS transporter n=1 Tax=Mycolicibacterium fortuitum TaxID=1766 RepID=A0AAE4VIZ1_MYCFO|nr:multidrug effflux MFS transporter [Mycolicibacterium fortuitum]AIY47641.1 Multidrug resistance transporter, Bcr/CflA family [Mycobacterium sp. VKM Ac-1817D]CRL82183.1 permease of the major facilitator superfamily protein [Mycolicibacter nonchromogenicus]MCV7144292.1 multidrug effflux MFS transporter [Mycolicibacterium fortuitum]MDV7194378.1 multidrug effflux MFS transporter [Mycolicibacterium fortuitum]MDV7208007.1 multidrug effflux MFS transporter [Mycolicibacterium fortuitum]